MKKILKLSVIIITLLGFILTAKSQDIVFSDGFENTASSEFSEPWTTESGRIDSILIRWHIYIAEESGIAPAGKNCAYIDTRQWATNGLWPEPPKTEWLKLKLPNKLDANKSARLSFKWSAQSIESIENKNYNTWVLVSTNEGITWDTLWSLTHEKEMVNSGVNYPWANWGDYKSELDLSKYKDKNITIAWLYKNFYTGKGQVFKLDDVVVDYYTPLTAPVANVTPNKHKFAAQYVNLLTYSGNVFVLTNLGIDTLRVTSMEGLENSDFSCDVPWSDFELVKNQMLKFGAFYEPTKMGAPKDTLFLNTNGGRISIILEGGKKPLPTNYTVESFEGELMPPLGWTMDDSWRASGYAAASGYYSLSCGVTENASATTPRLDLSQGSSHYIEFKTVNLYDITVEGASTYTDNQCFVEFTEDGGSTWTELKEVPIQSTGEWITHKLTLNSSSDNCHIRFRYFTEGEFNWELELSQWYIDDIVLPLFYGGDLAPDTATNRQPLDRATNQFSNNLELSWSPVLHASSYLLKVGTSPTNLTDIIDMEVTEASYFIPSLGHNTTYYWQVIPKNANGQAVNNKTQTFKTMSDQGIKTFPYFEGFENEEFPSLGWRTEAIEGDRAWSRTDISPYEGEYTAMVGHPDGSSFIVTPAITLPSDKDMQAAFMWGNDMPIGLNEASKDKEPKTVGADTGYFEISSDGNIWNIITFISEVDDDSTEWRRFKFPLTDYKGETIYLRWRYSCVDYFKAPGLSLDNVVVEEYSKNGKIVYNKTMWNANKVNYKEYIDSKNELTILNDGAVDLVIESVSFGNSNFSTDLIAGISIVKDISIPFKLTFTATNPGDINDTMTIKFNNGLISKLPLAGYALDNTQRFYDFEEDEAFSIDNFIGFNTYDEDGLNTFDLAMINFPGKGSPYAFKIMNTLLADWRNVLPPSGNQCLHASGPDYEGGDQKAINWLISNTMLATETSELNLFAKTYGTPGDWSTGKITIKISEQGELPATFENHPGAISMPVEYSETNGGWQELTIDLSAYAGKTINVAIIHEGDTDNLGFFIDDVWFKGFTFEDLSNQAPRFTTTPPTEALLNKPFSYAFKVVDPDGDKITITAKGLPHWLTMTTDEKGGGLIEGTPIVAGPANFFLIAEDSAHETEQQVSLIVKEEGGDGNDTVSNENFKKISILFYPNPVKTILNIKADFSFKVEIINSLGVIIMQEYNIKELNVEHLKAGTYFMRIIDLEKRKIVVERFIKY